MTDQNQLRPEELAMAMDGQPEANNFVEFADRMLEESNIPKDVRSGYWGFINNGRVLTISNDKDRIRSENRLCILRNLYFMGMPQYKINITMLREFSNTQNMNTINTSRSVNGFERQALMTQIKQLITSRDETKQEKGFLAGFKKKLGLGPKEEEMPRGR